MSTTLRKGEYTVSLGNRRARVQFGGDAIMEVTEDGVNWSAVRTLKNYVHEDDTDGAVAHWVNTGKWR